MPKGVTCSVSNCHFWEKGNECGAKEIKIDMDQHSGKWFHAEFSNELADHQHEDIANESSETCCLTFKAKE